MITFAFGELGGGDEFAVFDLEGHLGLAAGGFGGGGDDFGAGGLGFQRGVIDGDADAAVFFDEELGLFAAEIEEEALAGTEVATLASAKTEPVARAAMMRMLM